MDKLTDHELVLQLQGSSLEALGALYDRHSRLVYRTALIITGDPEAASDLLQDVYLRLYRFADRDDPERPLEPWLYRVTANQAYTWVKRHQRWSHPLEEIAEILESPEGTVKSRLHYGRRALRNHLGLDGLPVWEMGYEFT